MKVKIDLRLEIIEGEDSGYILEEKNKILNLVRPNEGEINPYINPYRLILDFITPNLTREWREYHRRADQ